MPKLVVQGRDYPWPDPTTITFREAQVIKKRLGFSVLMMFQNLSNGQFDEDTLLGMFVLAKMRTDGDFDLDQVLELGLTDIAIEDDAEEVEEEDAAPLEEAVVVDAEDTSETAPKPRQKKSASSNA